LQLSEEVWVGQVVWHAWGRKELHRLLLGKPEGKSALKARVEMGDWFWDLSMD